MTHERCFRKEFDTNVAWADGTPVVLGIDEAGRGPALGPMVYAALYCQKGEGETMLRGWKVDDSKKMTAEFRSRVEVSIREHSHLIGFRLDIISPEEISAKMLQKPAVSLNEVSHDSAIALVRHAVDKNVNVVDVYVDTVGPTESYQKKLENEFPSINITVSEKADGKFPVVSAASIMAKTERDRRIENWTFKENGVDRDEPLGSGYPGDEQTKAFLRSKFHEIFGFPSIVRFSWSTSRVLLEERGVVVDWLDGEEENSRGVRKRKLPPAAGKRQSTLFAVTSVTL